MFLIAAVKIRPITFLWQFLIMNSDDEFKKITHKNISNMYKKFIIDTRRILKISNVEYIALGKNSDNY